MKLKKILYMAVGAVLLSSASSFALPSDWSGDGWVNNIYVGSPSAYSAPTPAVIFTLTGGTGVTQFSFPLDGSDFGKALLSQLYAAKINGWKVQVANDGMGNYAGNPRVDRFVNLQ